MNSLLLRLGLVGTLFAAVAGRGDGQEAPAAPAEEAPKDWLEFYYEDPRPEEFVERVKDWAKDGTLQSQGAQPALVAFMSQVLRQNRARVREWYQDLSGLSQDQLAVFLTSMFYARIRETDEILDEAYGSDYAEKAQELGKILDRPLDKVDTLDMLWGYFYATGSESAIRRLVQSFRFKEAPDRPKGVDIPEGYMPFYKILPQLAFESLLANAERHPRVMTILRSFLEEDSSLHPTERQGIEAVLEEIGRNTDSKG